MTTYRCNDCRDTGVIREPEHDHDREHFWRCDCATGDATSFAEPEAEVHPASCNRRHPCGRCQTVIENLTPHRREVLQ